MKEQLFDKMPDKYTAWFQTPIGRLVKATEMELTLELLKPGQGERILDVGCGSGIFTEAFLQAGSELLGIDLSLGMLRDAERRLAATDFTSAAADMYQLPFADQEFDKTVSITALEFVEDAQQAINEMIRVTKPGGWIVVSTLNSLSPWAVRRTRNAEQDQQSVFREAYFRSPTELAALFPSAPIIKTAVHFTKDADPDQAVLQEQQGKQAESDSGAYLIAAWQKS